VESCERENLMIEHPSIFVSKKKQNAKVVTAYNENQPPQEVPVIRNRTPGSAKRSQRRASRQVLKNMTQQKKKSVKKSLKQKCLNRNFNKMRFLVQQPRKHY